MNQPPDQVPPTTQKSRDKLRLGISPVILVFGPCLMVAIVAILVGLLMPALNKAKQKAQNANCQNTLRAFGDAFRTWAGEHNDSYPFNVSTNSGGTLEFCSVGADGFDRNSWRHWQVLSNEINNPRLLVCLADGERKVAADFQKISAANITYLIHSGSNVNLHNTNAVLAYCPIHHNVLMADGTVKMLSEKEAEAMLFGIAEEERTRHK